MPCCSLQVYIDKKKTVADGRKLPQHQCVEYPQMQELKEVLEHLGFETAYEVCDGTADLEIPSGTCAP